MKLTTTWNDGEYIWHYFTTFQAAADAAVFGVPLETSPNLIWRSRVARAA